MNALMRRRGALAATMLLLAVFLVQLVRVAQGFSATWDEPHHLFDGYTVWTRGDHRLNPEVPPLVKLVAALPLLPTHLAAPPNQGRAEPEEAFRDGRAFVFGNGAERTLTPARYACTVFALALAALVAVAAWEMYGASAAVIALVLLTFDPNVLANGSLVTTDTASAACMFAAVLAFRRHVRTSRPVWLVSAGLATGLALSAKFTGVLLAPMLILLAAWEGWAARSLAVFGRRLAGCMVVGLLAWVVVWAVYGFAYAPARGGLALSPALAPYLQSLPDPKDARVLSLLANFRVLPEAYIWGLANTKLTEFADTAYFFGHVYRHGPWTYFPAAFLIKATLPLLILLGAAPFVLRRRAGERIAYLLIPVAVYFAVVSSSHFDIGVRHLLPVYPFLYVLAAGAATALTQRRAGAALVAVLLGWQGVTCLRAWPAYMAYGNEAWGGPRGVHRYLSDANVDWGQQLKAVKTYLDDNHIHDCWFAYFPDGAIEPSDYGVPCRRLPTTDTLWWLNLSMDVPPVIEGTVLISDSVLEGIEFGDGSLNPYDDFRRRTPDAVIQGGVNVYHGRFAVPLAAALVRVRESSRLQAAGSPEAALDVASAAVDLAPSSAIVQLRLADMLAAVGRRTEARAHYLAAQDLVRRVRPDLQSADLGPKIQAGLTATR